LTAAGIRIEADGRLTMPAPLLLIQPGRLVLDLAGVSSGPENIPVPANRFGIVRCRLGTNNDKLRLVFEVSGNSFPGFRLQQLSNGIEILPAP
jgi:hypothetical protein